MQRIVRLLALIGVLTTTAMPAAAQGCTAEPLTSLPLLAQAGRLMVEVQVNGHPARFVLDTGATNSVLNTALVERLGLPTLANRAQGTRDLGGGGTERFASNARITVGAITSTSTWWRYAVADLSADGLLGSDLLRRYDVDLDFAGMRMSVYARGACFGTAPGPGPVAVLSTAAQGSSAFGRLSRLRVPIRLDGRQLWAILDTGAVRSYFAASAAREEFGLDIRTMNPSRARGAYGGELAVAPHDFRELEIGNVSLPRPRLSLTAPDRGFDEAPILLGLEHLRHLRLFVVYAVRRVYVSPATQP